MIAADTDTYRGGQAMGIRIPTLIVALAFAAFARAEDKPGDGAAGAAKDADAMLKEIQEMRPPAMNADKRGDREYMQKFFSDMMETYKKRGERAREFVEKYPDHPRKADALYIRAESLMRGGQETSTEFKEAADAFIKAAPADDRGGLLTYVMAEGSTDAETKSKLFHQIIEKYPRTPFASMARAQLRKVDDVGKPFELEFSDAVSGKKYSMKDLKGKVVVVDFWATWCGPCVQEMPAMKKLYTEYKDQGVEFIGVSLDQAGDGLDKLKTFVAENEITWPQFYQGKGWESEFSRGWGINSIPCVFVVDADGKLETTMGRGNLEKLIPELLKKREKPAK
jgi:thiol-disulfide isomerase/thioredoxin